tara:strand:- start:251 stop:739 length:489 start_codon:yes stop_codon:yes gene_type:complete
MIITCPNCKKQFKIDTSLIPVDGRDVQCGSCNNVWFYQIDNENSSTLKLNEEINNNENDIDLVGKKEEKYTKSEITALRDKDDLNNKISKNKQEQIINKKIEKKENKFFSYLIVFFISLIAVIILLDTVKTPLIGIFPSLEILLFNLYETLKDIKLFIIDLI